MTRDKERVLAVIAVFVLIVLMSPLLILFAKAWKTLFVEAVEWDSRLEWGGRYEVTK